LLKGTGFSRAGNGLWNSCGFSRRGTFLKLTHRHRLLQQNSISDITKSPRINIFSLITKTASGYKVSIPNKEGDPSWFLE
jgi:hypothetical protein